jgi:hypothetical protein
MSFPAKAGTHLAAEKLLKIDPGLCRDLSFWEAPLDGDLKEVVGTLMRVLGGEKISRREVEDLAFGANGELQLALNRAYIKLLEFAYDCDAGLRGQSLTDEMRAELQHCLREIVRCADPSLTNGNEVTESEA